MAQFPRMDEIEDLLEEEWNKGSITINLEEDLIAELKELNLLDNIIRSRVAKLTSRAIHAHFRKREREQRRIHFRTPRQNSPRVV